MQTGTAFKHALTNGEIISFDYEIPGSRIFLPNGWKIRNKIVAAFEKILTSEGFDAIGCPNLITKSALEKLDRIYPLSQKYIFGFGDLRLAASHEVVIFSFLGKNPKSSTRYLKQDIKWYLIAPAFRLPKSAESPFSFGERSTFVEAYFISKSSKSTLDALIRVREKCQIWLRDELFLPVIPMERPSFGNNSVFDKSYTFECILESGRTLTTVMLYDQGNLFTHQFFKTKESNLVSAHFGLTDNTIYAFLSTHLTSDGFAFPADYSPYHIYIVKSPDASEDAVAIYKNFTDLIDSQKWSFKTFVTKSRSSHTYLSHARNLGIPIFVHIKERKKGFIEIWTRATFSDQSAINCEIFEIINHIQSLLYDHDERIKARVYDFRNSRIKPCLSIAEVNSAVADSCIANYSIVPKCHESIPDLVKHIHKGEILGYSLQLDCTKNPEVEPSNIKYTSTSLFIGRRI